MQVLHVAIGSDNLTRTVELTQVSLEQQKVKLNTMQTALQTIANHLNIRLHIIAENETFNKVSNTNKDVNMHLE